MVVDEGKRETRWGRMREPRPPVAPVIINAMTEEGKDLKKGCQGSQ